MEVADLKMAIPAFFTQIHASFSPNNTKYPTMLKNKVDANTNLKTTINHPATAIFHDV